MGADEGMTQPKGQQPGTAAPQPGIVVAIGASAGALGALRTLLGGMPAGSRRDVRRRRASLSRGRRKPARGAASALHRVARSDGARRDASRPRHCSRLAAGSGGRGRRLAPAGSAGRGRQPTCAYRPRFSRARGRARRPRRRRDPDGRRLRRRLGPGSYQGPGRSRRRARSGRGRILRDAARSDRRRRGRSRAAAARDSRGDRSLLRRGPPRPRARSQGGSDSDAEPLGELLALLATRTQRDFSVYRRSVLARRIGKRMRLRAIDDWPNISSCYVATPPRPRRSPTTSRRT